VAAEQIRNMPSRQAELGEMQRMVDTGLGILAGRGSLRAFGELMNEGWRLKRSLGRGVSSDAIDAMYEGALRAGAVGGKLCGAGGGGFLLLFVEPDRRQAVAEALKDRLIVPFGLDWEGSQIIFYHPDRDAAGRRA
jgi:D-glycero-alpha-D-manno-heptose-7-phosphate kinase